MNSNSPLLIDALKAPSPPRRVFASFRLLYKSPFLKF